MSDAVTSITMGALVSNIFAAFRTALTRHPGNPDALTFWMP